MPLLLLQSLLVGRLRVIGLLNLLFLLLLGLFEQLTVSLDRGGQQKISDLIVVSFDHSKQSLCLFQVEHGVLGVTNVQLELSQVLHSHTEAESPEVLLRFVLSAVRLTRFQELNKFGHVAEYFHSVVNGTFPPDLLRVVVDLSVEVFNFGDVSELLGHVLNELASIDVRVVVDLPLHGLVDHLLKVVVQLITLLSKPRHECSFVRGERMISALHLFWIF